MLKENLAKVEENIQAACDRAGRKREEVTLIAVSKTKPLEILQKHMIPVFVSMERTKHRTSLPIQKFCQKISTGI